MKKDVVKEVAVSVWSNVCYMSKWVLKLTPTLINVANPIISMMLVKACYEQRGYWAVGGEMIVPFVLALLAALIEDVKGIVYEELGGIPVARKRYTKRDSKGHIVFNTSDMFEMAEYLAEVEDTLERHGKYRGVK